MKITRTQLNIITALSRKVRLTQEEYLTVLLETKYKEVFKKEYHRI